MFAKGKNRVISRMWMTTSAVSPGKSCASVLPVPTAIVSTGKSVLGDDSL